MMTRQVSIAMLAVLVTFVLFGFMQFLIQNQQRPQALQVKLPEVFIADKPEDSQQNEIVRDLPKPPPVPKAPELKPAQAEPSTIDNNFGIQTPGIVKTALKTDFSGDGINKNYDTRPLLRVEPRYPIAAARDGIEGWVELGFGIDPLGRVVNIKIIDSEPRQLFDKEARRALRKWKYQPKMVDGVATAQHNLAVRLDFNLSQ